ncbi:MAG: ketoacyl-ACP synthase III [Chloroflexi bacterium]|nr:ketoacyl-ACP synthase III [Chloroflexota bacterium]
MDAYIRALASYLPEAVVHNDPAHRLTAKTGVLERHIAGPQECASDLGVRAGQRLFETGVIAPADVDFLIFCTQSPDYFLPSTACTMQPALGLRYTSGALDINLGCSGFVYGLAVAKGLIESGVVGNVLLITAETYSKYIHPQDNSVLPLFGDGAAATLIAGKADGGPYLHSFVLGTDGTGAENLIVPLGGHRGRCTCQPDEETTDAFGNVRRSSNLYMNGAELLGFALLRVPELVGGVCAAGGVSRDEVDWFYFHQANLFMNEKLRAASDIPVERFPQCVAHCGNTVSATIPLLMEQELQDGRLKLGDRCLLAGFGVGYSWAGCLVEWTEPE